MKRLLLITFLLISFSAVSAPVGFGDVELTTVPPTERDWCMNPIGETIASLSEKGLTCLEWQSLPSDEISHYIYKDSNGALVANVPHVINYVDSIFADVILTYGDNVITDVTYDIDGRVSLEKTFTLNVVTPKGSPKSQGFSMRQKPPLP